MRVLLTGASGFLGTNLVWRLPQDWEVVRTTCDLRHPAFVKEVTEHKAFDLGIHLAANVRIADSTQDPSLDIASLTMLNNVLSTFTFDRFLFLSSGAVYDGLLGPVTPLTPSRPTLPYAIMKLAGERLVESYAARRGTVKSYCNVRFFGAYGPHEPSWKLPSRLVRAAHAHAETFLLQGDGENFVDYLYIEDVVAALLLLIAKWPANRQIDLSGRKPMTTLQFCTAVRDILGANFPIVPSGTTAEYNNFFSIDSTLATLGWAPRTPLETGIPKLADWLACPSL